MRIDRPSASYIQHINDNINLLNNIRRASTMPSPPRTPKRRRSVSTMRTVKKRRTINATKTRTNSTTAQRDSKVQYVHKRAPKRKRVSWGKFVKKVQAANESQEGTTTMMRNTVHTFQTGLGPLFKLQQYFATFLYGHKGTVTEEQGSQDMWSLMDSDNRIDLAKNQRVKIVNAVLDVTVTNTGEVAVEVDLYKVLFTKKSNVTQSLFSTLATGVTATETSTANVSPANNTSLDINDRGATLFDVPEASRMSGMKIFSKQKFFIKPNESITYQVRVPKTVFLNSGNYVEDNSQFILPYKTQGLIGIFKPVAGLGDNSSVAVGTTRTYKYKLLANNKTFGTVRV